MDIEVAHLHLATVMEGIQSSSQFNICFDVILNIKILINKLQGNYFMNRLTLQATLCSIGMVVEAVFLVVLEAVVCLAVEEEELSAWALELDFQVCAFTSSNALYVDIITRITLEALPSFYKYFSGV